MTADIHLSSQTLSVAVCQLTSIDDISLNLKSIFALLRQLESQPPDLVCLPENALYMRIKEGELISPISIESDAIRSLAEWCMRVGSALHVGSLPLSHEGRLYNASLLLTPDGRVHDIYRKIHLFDVDVAGEKSIRESDVFARGEKPAIFDLRGWRIGSSICYDLRFSELFLCYARAEVDLILIPSAFIVPTGQAHWDVLIRARAIESQSYVVAAAQGGVHKGIHGGQRSTFGHSMIVDPWGAVIECMDGSEKPRVLRAVLTKERISQVRKQIPMKNHRRL